MRPPLWEFRAIRRPDGSAVVLYVREDSPSCGTLHAPHLSADCEAVANEHNRDREAREAEEAAGQGELFP